MSFDSLTGYQCAALQTLFTITSGPLPYVKENTRSSSTKIINQDRQELWELLNTWVKISSRRLIEMRLLCSNVTKGQSDADHPFSTTVFLLKLEQKEKREEVSSAKKDVPVVGLRVTLHLTRDTCEWFVTEVKIAAYNKITEALIGEEEHQFTLR